MHCFPCCSSHDSDGWSDSELAEYDFDGDFTIDERPLLLHVDEDPEGEDTGLFCWDCGIVLAKYMEHEFVPEAQKRTGKQQLRALEFGSGSGICGLSFALMGQSVLMTDIADEKDGAKLNTRTNMSQNQESIDEAGGSVDFQTLDWHELPDRSRFGKLDVVFASDCFWDANMVEWFGKALAWAASGPGANEFVVAGSARSKGVNTDAFEEMIPRIGFTITQRLDYDELEPLLGDFAYPKAIIWRLKGP